MGLFSFLKKKQNQEEPKEQEKLKLSKVDDFLSGKKKELKSEESEMLKTIKEKIEGFEKEIHDKINVLEKVDLNSKKEDERTKSIVHDSKKAYIELVENFLYKLTNMDFKNLGETHDKINSLFEDFNKSSNTTYEKATYLIGKEMVAIKNSFKQFSKNLLKTIDENKPLIGQFKKIEEVRSKQNKLFSQERAINENNESINLINEKIKQIKEEQKKALESFEKFKQTSDYKEVEEKKKNLKTDEENLKSNLIKLRSEIDFKALGNFFHFDEDKIKNVKNYKDNFSLYFGKSLGEDLIKLLKDSNLDKPQIEEDIKNTRENIKDLEKSKGIINNDKSRTYTDKIDKIDSELDFLTADLEKQNTRLGKLTSQKEEIKEDLILSLKKLGVEVEN